MFYLIFSWAWKWWHQTAKSLFCLLLIVEPIINCREKEWNTCLHTSDGDNKQWLKIISKHWSANLSLELALQLQKRSSGTVKKTKNIKISQIILIFWPHFDTAVDEHLPTGPRLRRLQWSNKTDCLWCWCWCWLRGGRKRSLMSTIDMSVLKITQRKLLKGFQRMT